MSEASVTPFGKYELLEPLGSGGMAVVYRARYTVGPGISKSVVIKRVLGNYSEDPAFVEMFIHEARISVGMSHGNIVQVFDFGQVEGEYFLAMELVDGHPLSRVLKRAKAKGLVQLPAPLAVSIAIEMCKGLHHAHALTDEQGQPLGVVHRDVSPENVLISYGGEVKITDFGIAKAELAGRPVTEAGKVKGKYLYVSPEQAQGQALDARSDLYAVGVVLYRMLCGRLPIEGNEVEVMTRIVRGQLTPALQLNPGLDAELVHILMRALATSKEARHQSAEELQQDLSRWLATRAPLYKPNTLKHLMGWLYAMDLSALGRPVVVPADFEQQMALWHGSPAAEEPPEAVSGEAQQKARTGEAQPERTEEVRQPRTQVLDSPAQVPAPKTLINAEAIPASRWKASLGWGLGSLAVVLVIVVAFVATRPHPLEIHSTPSGAQVRIDGQVLGATPLMLEDFERDAPHTVELLLLGWSSWEQTFGPGTIGPRLEASLEELSPPPPEPAEGEGDMPPEDPGGAAAGARTAPKPVAKPGLKITSAAQPSASTADAKYRKGMERLAKGQLKQAKELFWECLAHDSAAARCFRRLGEVSAKLGNTEEAVEYYTRFLELVPNGQGSKQARAYVKRYRE